MKETNIILSRGGFPPASARGCSQTLQPIENHALKRTVNGELISLVKKQHHKYKSVIKCNDHQPAALDGLWPGEKITVHCAQYLIQKTSSQNVNIDREFVNDSIQVTDQSGKNCDFSLNNDQIIIHKREAEEGPWFVRFRPILHMKVISYKLENNEWDEKNQWCLELEEA